MAFTYTPGPWNYNGVYICTVKDPAVIAIVANSIRDSLNWQCKTADLENLANARLIAAAPTMLAALYRIACSDRGMYTGDAAELGDMARAAIAAAEGV